MTFGQRIAQKRKEQGLSQEGLGEQLGVSRQAIYKWESDAAMPEIDKLITLSKLFSVPVGWLLGVEEAEPEKVSQDQEKLVEEVLSRYQAAQPPPRKSAWDKWPVRFLFAMCGIMIALLWGTSSKVKEMEQQYNDLHSSIYNVQSSVDRQIGSITGQVVRLLKSQNDLTAEWSAELASTDLRANTAAFAVRVVPRTYVEGMTAVFAARSGEDTVELPVEAGADHAFSGQITCPLTDDITVSVVLISGDKRETQLLNNFYGLYSNTFPDLQIDGLLWFDERDGVLPNQISTKNHRKQGIGVRNLDSGSGADPLNWYPDPPATLQVGLFRDRKLLFWYEGGREDVRVNNALTERYVWRRPQDVTLEPGHEYCEAIVYTDEYGRQQIYAREGLSYSEQSGSWEPSGPVDSIDFAGSSPIDWEF